jgi:glycosyltransferase involved in cell wall biosynthesis
MRTVAKWVLFLIWLPVRLRRLRRLINAPGIDVIYTNTITVLDGALAAWLLAKPHIWHLREHVRGNRGLDSFLPARWVARVVYSLSTRIICNSFFLKRELFPRGDPEQKVRVVHNGADLAAFADAKRDDALRSSLDLPSDAPVVGILGYVHEGKGHHTFLQAATLVSERHPLAHFVVVGSGPAGFVQRLKDLGESLGLTERLRFVGWRQDVPALLSMLDVLVLASEQESFGRTLIEGMAAGKPIVATRSGGPEEIVVHGETGFLVPVGDARAMAHSVCLLLDDPTTRKVFGESGRQRVENQFTLEEAVRGVENVIVEAVAYHRSLAGTVPDDTRRGTP